MSTVSGTPLGADTAQNSLCRFVISSRHGCRNCADGGHANDARAGLVVNAAHTAIELISLASPTPHSAPAAISTHMFAAGPVHAFAS